MLDVIKNRYLYVGLSLVGVLISLVFIFFGKMNLGIDLTGGTQIEYSFNSQINFAEINSGAEKLKNEFNKANNNIINGLNIYTVYGEKKVVFEIGYSKLSDEKKFENIKNSFKEGLTTYLHTKNATFILDKYVDIGQSFGDYIKKTAILTLTISLILIAVYVGYAFFGVAIGVSSLHFAGVSLVTLFHDVLFATGFYIFTGFFFPEFKVDTFFITALLTILGYSINDTIVVFDRIRENVKIHLKTKKLAEIINLSINETLTRSVYTSLTLIIVVITIFIFGPESLKGFMLVLFYGVAFGTYSSIFVAAPLLYELNKNNELKVYEKKIISDIDKVVV